MTLQPLAELLPDVVAQLSAHHPRGAPVTAWLAVPVTNVFCPTVRPDDGAPCHLLVHTSRTHVAGDGEDWTDPEETAR